MSAFFLFSDITSRSTSTSTRHFFSIVRKVQTFIKHIKNNHTTQKNGSFAPPPSIKLNKSYILKQTC